jgi:hypothetical protein
MGEKCPGKMSKVFSPPPRLPPCPYRRPSLTILSPQWFPRMPPLFKG